MTTPESPTPLQEYPVSTRTRVEQGVWLHWEYRARYGPPINTRPKGEIEREGEVFVAVEDLYALNDFGAEYRLGESFSIDTPYAGEALAQAGLAEKETRGGIHATPKLSVWLAEYERSRGEHGENDQCAVSSEVEV